MVGGIVFANGKSRSLILAVFWCFLCGSPGLCGDNASESTDPGRRDFEVARLDGAEWQVLGHLTFGVRLEQQRLNLDGDLSGDAIFIRIRHLGTTGCHLDSIDLGGRAPCGIQGVTLDPSVALNKVSADDLDVIDMRGASVVFEFDDVSSADSLDLTARVEPKVLSKLPLRFPTQNVFCQLSNPQTFFSYQLNSRPGSLRIDGELIDEDLGRPFFDVFSRILSGHPDDRTLGWVCNDETHLYLALDVIPDNTLDDGADYGHVIVKSGDRMQAFRVTTEQTRWGRTGFTTTDFAAYQHKTYEFAIPLDAAGFVPDAEAQSIELAFAVYGTVAILPMIDDFEGPVTGQVLSAASGSNGTSGLSAPAQSIAPYRDLVLVENSGMGSLGLQLNANSSGLLVFDSTTGGVGGATVVWDGDDDETILTPFMTWNFSMFDRVTLVGVSNTGTAAVDVSILFHSASAPANFTTGGPITLNPGVDGDRTPIEMLFSSFVPTGTVNWNDIGIVELLINNEQHGAGGLLSMREIVLSDVPVPVELQSIQVQ